MDTIKSGSVTVRHSMQLSCLITHVFVYLRILGAAGIGIMLAVVAVNAADTSAKSNVVRGIDALPVYIQFQPITSTVFTNQIFTVKVQIQAGAQPIDGAEVHFNFAPAHLRVVQMTGAAALPVVLIDEFSNSLGTLDYAAGTFSSFPSGNIDLVTIQFEALQPVSLTNLVFQHVKPRQTDVTFSGASILTNHRDGAATILSLSKIYLPLIKR